MNLTTSEALQFVDAIAADRATLARIRAALAAVDDDGDLVDAVIDLLDEVRRGGVRVPDSVLESVWIDVRRLAGPPCMSEGLDGAIRRAVDALAAACPGDGPIVDRVVAALKARESERMRLESVCVRYRTVLDGINDAVASAQSALTAAGAPEAPTLAERVRALVAERDKARAAYAAATEEVARLRVEAGNARERAYAAERERDTLRAKASAERATPRDGDRFVVDSRIGIVAIYDTDHLAYVRPAGCHWDFPWTVCHWSGDPLDDRWVMRPDYVAAAERVCALLNDLDAKARR